VVIPLLDPDAHVSGKGIEHLAQAGIEVVTGIGREEAAASLAPYLHQRLLKRPFCLLKAAISMDGRIAACDGSSQWITSAEARENGHLLRSQSQAIVVGAETVLADRPTLTARGVPIHKQPLRVLLDSRGRVPVTGALADTTLAPTLVCTSSREKEEAWKEKGVDVLYSPKKIELPLLLTHLAQLGVIQLLIEGGSSLYAHFLSASLVDQITLYVGNCLLGDQAKPLLSSLGIPSLVEAPRWSLQSVCRLGESARLDFTPFAERETSS
jgi:diaminohydroxyphosphoribosylaminopyrimidine deaminase/5-amino-6-(5-phosphoribosylamino)uracil reductase